MRARLAGAAAALALGGALLAPAPAAQAGNMVLTHSSPDAGYSDAFYVQCVNGSYGFIYTGMNSAQVCGAVTRVYVYGGTQLVCWYAGIGWRVWKDATGWHDAGGSSQSCVNQYD